MTLVDLSSAIELVDPSCDTEVENHLSVAEFARQEVGRLNSIVGATISDLELALELFQPESTPPQTESAISDALVGSRQLAQFLRILGRLNAIDASPRREQRLKSCVEGGAERARKRNSTPARIVLQIDSADVYARYDFTRISQAVAWLTDVVAAALDRANPEKERRLIDISVRVDSDRVTTLVAQNAGVFESLPYFLEIDVVAHWYFEAARLLLSWEGLKLHRVGDGDFGGFAFTVPRISSVSSPEDMVR